MTIGQLYFLISTGKYLTKTNQQRDSNHNYWVGKFRELSQKAIFNNLESHFDNLFC